MKGHVLLMSQDVYLRILWRGLTQTEFERECFKVFQTFWYCSVKQYFVITLNMLLPYVSA